MPADDATIKFSPYFDRVVRLDRGPFIGRAVLCASVAALYVVPYLIVTPRPFIGSGWFLGVMIASGAALLLTASAHLRRLLDDLDAQPHDPPIRAGERSPARAALLTVLIDRRFILAGVFFATLNTSLGWLFQPPGDDAQRLTALWGYAVVGYVCGTAAWGIVGVIVMMRAFARTAKPPYDPDHPDGCGGMAHIGGAITVFASVTLIMGAEILVYLAWTDWGRRDAALVQAAIVAWAVFPFLMSLSVLTGPWLRLRDGCVRFKRETDIELKHKLAHVRDQLEAAAGDDEYNRLRDKEALLIDTRRRVYAMREWPYSAPQRIQYLSVTIGALAAIATSLSTLMDFAGGG